jgi:hypothetical protein
MELPDSQLTLSVATMRSEGVPKVCRTRSRRDLFSDVGSISYEPSAIDVAPAQQVRKPRLRGHVGVQCRGLPR